MKNIDIDNILRDAIYKEEYPSNILIIKTKELLFKREEKIQVFTLIMLSSLVTILEMIICFSFIKGIIPRLINFSIYSLYVGLFIFIINYYKENIQNFVLGGQ